MLLTMNNERRLIPLADVKPSSPSWLFPDLIPMGTITVLSGDPGQSKSTLMLDLAARITTGRPMPFAQETQPPAGVVLLQAEDDVGTVKQNLKAAGADEQRVFVYVRERFSTQPLLLPADLPLIAQAVDEVQARLVVIDPLAAFLGEQVTSDAGARRVLGPLAVFAERKNLAVVIVRHLTKQGSRNPVYRAAGSIGVIAIARSGLLVGKDPHSDCPHQHVLAQTKGNLATAKSLVYRTVLRAGGIAVEWVGESECGAHEISSYSEGDPSALREAAYFLFSILESGPMHATEVFQRAGQNRIAIRTLRRAKTMLHVRSWKKGSGWCSRWYWELPKDENLLQPYKEMDAEQLMEDSSVSSAHKPQAAQATSP
jgi:hypothetical protein